MKSELARVAVLIDTSTSWGRRIIQGINTYNRQHGCWQVFIETRGEGEALRLPEGWASDGVIALVNSAPSVTKLSRHGVWTSG
jgi:LacI family transcriptional regulator